MVALVVEQSTVWVLNVGDSRCYRLRDGKLEQLTLDHSLVEEQVRLGRMTKHEALRSPLRNVITRAVGTQNAVTPDCFQFEAQPGDLVPAVFRRADAGASGWRGSGTAGGG